MKKLLQGRVVTGVSGPTLLARIASKVGNSARIDGTTPTPLRESASVEVPGEGKAEVNGE